MPMASVAVIDNSVTSMDRLRAPRNAGSLMAKNAQIASNAIAMGSSRKRKFTRAQFCEAKKMPRMIRAMMIAMVIFTQLSGYSPVILPVAPLTVTW